MIALGNARLGLVLLVAFTLLRAGVTQADRKQPGEEKKDEEPVYDLVAGVTPPRLLKHVNPQYPPDWKGVRVEGNVGIGIVVTSQGTPKELKVIKSLEKDLDRFAVDAVREWRFAAARKDGKPVAVRVTIEIEFHSM